MTTHRVLEAPVVFSTLPGPSPVLREGACLV